MCFSGTDNIEALMFAREMYGEKTIAGYSIPAREHSTTTCYLRDGEHKAFMNSVEKFGSGYFSVVIDSYSTDKALQWLTTDQAFIKLLTEKGGTCVIRPDSGSPIDMVMKCLNAVAKNVGYTVNEKGYKVLDQRFRVIQGDGVNIESIQRIVTWMTEQCHYSMENLVFGMGGGLLQQCDRDTQKFAMKCCAMKVNGFWRDVYKSPETDPSKKSKAGLLDVEYCSGDIRTVIRKEESMYSPSSCLRVVFKNGTAMNMDTITTVRSRVDNEISLII